MNISKSSFFKNLALSLFYLYSPLTSCKKSEKSLEPLLRKLHYQPTNQATNYYQQHRSYRSSLTPVQKIYENIQVTSEVKHIGELSFFHVLLMRVDRKSETTVFCKETVWYVFALEVFFSFYVEKGHLKEIN